MSSNKMYKDKVYRKYIFDEMSKNKEYDITDLEYLVKSLNNNQAKELCRYFSYYRRNCAYDFISKGPDNWQTGHIDISDIRIEKINPRINHYLEKNDWSLKKISNDKDIAKHDEFKSHGTIDPKISNFIAKKTGHKYIIVDGMHRIIRLACDGKKKFKLIYY